MSLTFAGPVLLGEAYGAHEGRDMDIDVTALRTAVERWKNEGHGHRIGPEDLVMRYNDVARVAATSNRLGRFLTAHGVKGRPDQGKRWRHVLDARGAYLPEWAALFGEPTAPAEDVPDSDIPGPGLREGDVYAVHDGRLVLILPADDGDVEPDDRVWIQGLLDYALESSGPTGTGTEPEAAASPMLEPEPDSGGTLITEDAMAALRTRLSGVA